MQINIGWPTLGKVIQAVGLSLQDCHQEIPRNDQYHAIGHGGGAICKEEALFLGGLIAIHKPDVIFELGTSWGASALAIGAILKDESKGVIFTVDLADEPPRTEEVAKALELPVLYVTKTNSMDFLDELEIKPELRYMVFSDTDIPMRPDEVNKCLEIFPEGTLIAVHDTSDEHPLGPMKLPERVPTRPIVELPSPRGLSILKV